LAFKPDYGATEQRNTDGQPEMTCKRVEIDQEIKLPARLPNGLSAGTFLSEWD